MSDRPPGGPVGNDKARTHGMYAVAMRGSAALAPELRDRERAIVKNLGTGPGALAELERVGLYYMLILEQAAYHLRQLAEQGKNPWTAGEDGKPIPLLSRLGTYMARALPALWGSLGGDRCRFALNGDVEVRKAALCAP